MAYGAVERAARVRESLAKAVAELRGGSPESGSGDVADGRTEAAKEEHDRDVNALLSHTRSVIDRTRRVIDQARANLQRLAEKGGGERDAPDGSSG